MGWFSSFISNPLGRLSKDTSTFTNAIGQVVSAPEKLIGGVGESLVKTATSLTSDLAKAIIKAPTDISNSGSAFVKNLSNGVVKAGSTIAAIKNNILKNPLPMIETIALNAVGVPFPVAQAAVSAMNGGSIEKMAISYATALVGGEIGSYAGSTGSSLLPSDLSAVELANAKAIITSSSATAAVAALKGGNMDAILKGAVVGGVAAYTKDELIKQGFDPKSINSAILNNAVTSATNAVLNGQDIGTAVGTAVAVTASTKGVEDAYNKYIKDDATIKSLNSQIQSNNNSYMKSVSDATVDKTALNKYLSDYKSQIGSANIAELDGYRTQVNAYNNNLTTAIDKYNSVTADIAANGDDANGTKLQSLTKYAEDAQNAKNGIDYVQTKSQALQDKLGITSYTNKIANNEMYERMYAQKAQDAYDQLALIAANKDAAAQELGKQIANYDKAVNVVGISEIQPIGDKTVEEYKRLYAEDQVAQAKAAAEAKAAADAQAAADAKAHAEQVAAQQAADAKAQAEAQAKAQAEAEAKAQAEAQAKAQADALAKQQAEAAAAEQAKQQAAAESLAQVKAQQEALAAKQAQEAEAAKVVQPAPPAPEPTPSPLATVTQPVAQPVAIPPAPPEQVHDTEMLPSTPAPNPEAPLPTAAETPTPAPTPSGLSNPIKATIAGAVGTGVKAAMTRKPVTPTLVSKPTGTLTTISKPTVAATVQQPVTNPISVTKPTGALTSVTSPFATAKPTISTTPTAPVGTLKKVASPFAKV